MTFMSLEDALFEEVGVILKDMQTDTADGKHEVSFKGYKHELPMLLSSEADEEELFPCYIIRIAEGETQDDNDCWHVAADIILCVHDQEAGGHRHILIAIQRIVDRFAEMPTMKAFRADQDIKWQAGEEDSYPYYYGAVTITFSVPKIQRRFEYV